MKVLLIGGTGTLSTDTTELCISKGYDVYLFNRGNRNIYHNMNIHYITGDINDIKNAVRLLENHFFDVVVDYLTYDVHTLKKRIKVFEGRINQYIFISSATVYPAMEERVSEMCRKGNDGWSYAKHKLECEKYLKENEFSFVYTIVRPYITYGDKRIPFPIISKKYSWNLIYRIQKRMPILMCGDGNQCVTLTNTKDFAVGIVGLFANKMAYNNDFNIVGDTVVTWNDVIRKLENYLGEKVIVVHVDTNILMKKIYSIGEELCFDKAKSHVYDNTKIKKAVPEFTTDYDLDRGLDITLGNLLSKEELQIVDYEWNAMEDVLCSRYGEKKLDLTVATWLKYLKKESKFVVRTKQVCQKFRS